MNRRPSLLARVAQRLTGRHRTMWSTWRILNGQFGHGLTVRRGEPLDASGRPIPWFTYPAIEYLDQLDFAGRSVFEFGAGNSTLYWSRRAARVVTIESDRGWFERIRSRAAPNVEMQLVAAGPAYPAALERRAERFDIIVIDGIERRACCSPALARLQPGGLVILDNSDWHHHCAAILRGAGLLEVDLAGFGPINGYTWTTSFFFHREFNFGPAHDRQPAHGIGSLPLREEA